LIATKRTILITGANTGIGAACATAMAAPGVHLVLACRSEAKTAPVLDAIRAAGAEASFVQLDLTSLASAAKAGEDFAKAHDTLDVLIDNAGIAGQSGLTQDGFEITFGVNHLGHFAFTQPLLPLLEKSAGRVVVVASGNHYRAHGIAFDRLRQKGRGIGLAEYGVSKLANVLFTAELRRRHPRIGAVSLNPGRIASDIWRRVPQPFRAILMLALRMKPVAEGGRTLVHAATIPLDATTPLYFNQMKARDPNPVALRADLAAELWDFSERAVRDARNILQ
jgi:NAD(P)-dependent dehydrogenase (short-subunit alcohol dehydrogenase family)